METNLEKLSNLFKFKMTKTAGQPEDLIERSRLLQEKIAETLNTDVTEEHLILNVLKEKYKNG
jgi:hypothetical protein